MTRNDLLTRLATVGAVLRFEADRLRCTAPRGAVSPALAAALLAEAPGIEADYGERAGILEYDGGLPREEAERQAAVNVLTPGGEHSETRVLPPCGSSLAAFPAVPSQATNDQNVSALSRIPATGGANDLL